MIIVTTRLITDVRFDVAVNGVNLPDIMMALEDSSSVKEFKVCVNGEWMNCRQQMFKDLRGFTKLVEKFNWS